MDRKLSSLHFFYSDLVCRVPRTDCTIRTKQRNTNYILSWGRKPPHLYTSKANSGEAILEGMRRIPR